MAESKVERFYRTLPPVFKPETNPMINALLKALAVGHDDLVQQIENAKAQLFIPTAQGQYLDRLASGVGVSRPATLGLLDSDFQKLVPVLSLEAKNIRKIFYDAMDVFWSPLYSRTNITSQTIAPFNVVTGDTLSLAIDGGSTQTAKALSGDIATQGAATATEIANILGRISGVTVSILTEPGTGNESINIRTNTPGPRGSIEVLSSTLTQSNKLGFTIKKTRITDLPERTVVWEINPRELLIELPAIIPTLRRTLKGSHHWHADSTLASPVPPANGIWQGSFLYDPSGNPYTVTAQSAVIQEQITAGNVYTKVTVNSTAKIPNTPGNLIFGWGMSDEEQPVKYINVPNSNTLLLDPGHVFSKTHPVGTYVNVLSSLSAYTPRTDGSDLAVYLTSPSDARSIVQGILDTLAASGVLVTFAILLPNYEYLIVNPYA